jgi:hypothetical protein
MLRISAARRKSGFTWQGALPRCIPKCRPGGMSGRPPCTGLLAGMKSPARDLVEPAPASDAPSVIHLGPPPDRARPKKAQSGSGKRRRSAGVFVRLLPEQLARLQDDAAAARMSMPGYLLAGRYGDDAAPPRRRPPAAVSVDRKALISALVAFNRANNNLNQTAHIGNAMMLFAAEHGAERLAELAADIARAVQLLRADMAPALAAILAALDYDPRR